MNNNRNQPHLNRPGHGPNRPQRTYSPGPPNNMRRAPQNVNFTAMPSRGMREPFQPGRGRGRNPNPMNLNRQGGEPSRHNNANMRPMVNPNQKPNMTTGVFYNNQPRFTGNPRREAPTRKPMRGPNPPKNFGRQQGGHGQGPGGFGQPQPRRNNPNERQPFNQPQPRQPGPGGPSGQPGPRNVRNPPNFHPNKPPQKPRQSPPWWPTIQQLEQIRIGIIKMNQQFGQHSQSLLFQNYEIVDKNLRLLRQYTKKLSHNISLMNKNVQHFDSFNPNNPQKKVVHRPEPQSSKHQQKPLPQTNKENPFNAQVEAIPVQKVYKQPLADQIYQMVQYQNDKGFYGLKRINPQQLNLPQSGFQVYQISQIKPNQDIKPIDKYRNVDLSAKSLIIHEPNKESRTGYQGNWLLRGLPLSEVESYTNVADVCENLFPIVQNLEPNKPLFSVYVLENPVGAHFEISYYRIKSGQKGTGSFIYRSNGQTIAFSTEQDLNLKQQQFEKTANNAWFVFQNIEERLQNNSKLFEEFKEFLCNHTLIGTVNDSIYTDSLETSFYAIISNDKQNNDNLFNKFIEPETAEQFFKKYQLEYQKLQKVVKDEGLENDLFWGSFQDATDDQNAKLSLTDQTLYFITQKNITVKGVHGFYVISLQKMAQKAFLDLQNLFLDYFHSSPTHQKVIVQKIYAFYKTLTIDEEFNQEYKKQYFIDIFVTAYDIVVSTNNQKNEEIKLSAEKST